MNQQDKLRADTEAMTMNDARVALGEKFARDAYVEELETFLTELAEQHSFLRTDVQALLNEEETESWLD